jgi:hypothetical protein
VVASGELGVRITQPAPGARLTPGTLVDVAGVLTVGAEPVTLKLTGVDGLGCVPVPAQELELVSTGKREETSWRFTGVPVGESGGTFKVTWKTGRLTGKVETSYDSPLVCTDCPPVQITEPTPEDVLEPYALAVLVSGSVTAGQSTPLLFSQDAAGHRLDIPLPLAQANPFTGRIIPVKPGLARVGVQVDSAGGSRTCSRVLTAVAASTPLSAHLSWEGVDADLDLVVVPPGRGYTAGACRARTTQAGCTVPTGDRLAPGPEAVLVDTLSQGTWGVMVLAVPGSEGPVRAVATVLAQGEVLGQSTPRELDPRTAQAWVVARVNVTAAGPLVEWLDSVVDEAPAGPPETW